VEPGERGDYRQDHGRVAEKHYKEIDDWLYVLCVPRKEVFQKKTSEKKKRKRGGFFRVAGGYAQ